MKENLKDISPILEETGRIIYSNANITVNTLPAILAALLLGACKYCQHIANTIRPLKINLHSSIPFTNSVGQKTVLTMSQYFNEKLESLKNVSRGCQWDTKYQEQLFWSSSRFSPIDKELVTIEVFLSLSLLSLPYDGVAY